MVRSNQSGKRLVWVGLGVLVLGTAAIAAWNFVSPKSAGSGNDFAARKDHADAGTSNARKTSIANDKPAVSSGAPPVIDSSEAPGPTPEGMVWVPAGEFSMGSDEPMFADARPIHRVAINGFWMDKTEVTNEQFAKFVKATNFVTASERRPRAEDFPGVPSEKLVAGSIVFSPPNAAVPLNDYMQWWAYINGANWRHPEGPQSDLKGRENHPVVHISHDDALAYAKWAEKRLPTEAEFEWAARGGLDRKKFTWGDEFKPDGKFRANSFQGNFPNKNTGEDGFMATAPVGTFEPNGFGIYDMAGNVWEWCSDWYRAEYYQTLIAQAPVNENPHGPANSSDPSEPGVAKRVTKGGSFLCTDQYCARYMPGGRGKEAPDTGTNHLGFRLVRDAK